MRQHKHSLVGPLDPLVDPRIKALRQSRWLIQLRWRVVLISAVLVVIACHGLHVLPLAVWWPLVATVSALGLSNIAYTAMLKNRNAIPRLLRIQVYADLGFLTVLLHFSGGIENPLAILGVFHVVMAGILFQRRECYTIVLVAAVLFAALAFAEWSNMAAHYTLEVFPHSDHGHGHEHAAHDLVYASSRVIAQIILLVTAAYFVTALADQERTAEGRLIRMTERAVTERRLLEGALATTETGLRVVDENLATRWANRHWEDGFSLSPPDANVTAGRAEECDASARLTFQDGRPRVGEVTFDAQDHAASHESRVVQVTTAPLSMDRGKVQQVVQLLQNVTGQKRAQAELLEAGKLAAVGELAGHVAHEINNPISIISAKARLLLAHQRAQMKDEVAAELAKIVDLSDRVARIAQGLLSYCRPVAAVRGPVDIKDAIRRALDTVAHLVEPAHIEVADNLETSPLIVEADSDQLQQIFLNLFLNALDAMPTGGRLAVSSHREGVTTGTPRERAIVVVEDTGAGIQPELLSKVTQPFFSTKTRGKGTGLGLSVCDGLIRSHGGHLGVTSEVGKGTTFTISLPLVDGGEMASEG